MSALRLISLTIPDFSDKTCQKNYCSSELYCLGFWQVAHNFSDAIVRKIIALSIGFISVFSRLANFSDNMTLTLEDLGGELRKRGKKLISVISIINSPRR